MTINNFKDLFYSVKISCICNFLSGAATLYVLLFWFPEGILKEDELIRLLMILGINISVGIFPILAYNLTRFHMVKSRELNYGIFIYTVSTILPFIAPMLIYYIAWLGGFRME